MPVPADVDVLVIGAGVAGLSAATWLARHRRRVLVLDAGEPRARWVERSHGYLGLDPVCPDDLLARGRETLARYPTAELRRARVTSAHAEGDGFCARIDGEELRARRLVLATGISDVTPDVEGLLDHYGADVFVCPACDGYEACDRRVVVLGWSEQVAGFALTLLNWAASVVVVTGGRTFEGERHHHEALRRHGIEVVEDRVAALLGPRGGLHAVRLGNGRTVDCEQMFFTIAHRPTVALAEQLGCRLDPEGYVDVDRQGQTSVAGVYAAGDCTPGMQLLQLAAAEGAVAGVSCALSLRGEPALPGTPEPGPDVEEELQP